MFLLYATLYKGLIFQVDLHVLLNFLNDLKNNANNTTNYVHWLVTMLSTRDLEKNP